MRIWVWINSFSRISKRLCSTSSRKGAALILFALALPIALGMMGLVLDGARSLYLKSRFDDALKAAALAATASVSLADRGKEAKKFFDINFPAKQWNAKVTGPTVTVTSSTVRVTASAECPTYLPNIVLDNSETKTPKTLTIQGWYETTLPNLEVVFVLSNTLRNQPVDQQTAIRVALESAITTLSQSDCYKNKYFGVIPFSHGVAIDHPDLFPNITSRNQATLNATFAPLAGYKFQDSRNEGISYEWINWSIGYLTWTNVNASALGFNHWRSYYNNQYPTYWQIYDLPDQYLKPWYTYTNLPRSPAISPQSWVLQKSFPYQGNFHPSAMLMARNVWPYEMPYYEQLDAGAANWTPFYLYDVYTRPMASLRSSAGDIISRLSTILHPTIKDPMQANNLPNLGMVWALRMLSPSWKGKWLDNTNPAESSTLPGSYDSKTHKIVVFVSPGLTSLSSDIVFTCTTTDPAQLVPQTFKNIMNEKFQYELFKRLHETYVKIDAQFDPNIPLNQDIPNSSCGSLNLWGCASKLQADYSNALTQLQSGFSNSVIDQIFYNLSLRYLWSSYLGNPTIAPQFSGQTNWGNILWDPNTVISGAWADASWQNGSSLYLFMNNENAPYCFSNVLFGSQIIINTMDYYLKIRHHKDNSGAVQFYRNNFYKKVWDWGIVGGHLEPDWGGVPPALWIFPPAAVAWATSHKKWVDDWNWAWFERIDYSVHTAQNVASGIWMKLGTIYNSETDPYLAPPIYLVRSTDGVPLGNPGQLAYNSWPNISTTFWYDSSGQEVLKRMEKGVQILNAHQLFSFGVIQSERDYLNQSNALSDTIASLEKTLWGIMPAYGILGTKLSLNDVSVGSQFNINGIYSSTLSDATARLNQAFLDVCGVMKDPQRNISIYTVNVGGSADDATMKACASSPLKHFYSDPSSPDNLSKAILSVADDIIASSAQRSLTGKSW